MPGGTGPQEAILAEKFKPVFGMALFSTGMLPLRNFFVDTAL